MAKLGIDKRLKYFALPASEVVSKLHSHSDGLTNPEATRRLEQHGANQLPPLKETTVIQKLATQLNPIVLILLLACLATLSLGESLAATWLAIAAALNVALGFWHTHKARRLDKSFDLLPKKATVWRSSVAHVIDAHKIVVGDIVQLKAGQTVPADLRLIEEEQLIIDDSHLTGETGPVRKFTHAIKIHVPLAKRHNLAFGGSHIISGEGLGVVIATGMQTELGHMASLAEAVDRKSPPVQLELNHLATRLGQLAILIGLALSLIFLRFDLSFDDVLFIASNFATALVPAGLVIIAVISLASQSLKLRRQNVIIQNLSALDTLGSTHIVLADQHELISQARLKPKQILVNKSIFEVKGTGKHKFKLLGPNGKKVAKKTVEELKLLLDGAALSGSPGQSAVIEQDSLLNLSNGLSELGYEVPSHHELLHHWPHDHGRQLSSSVYRYGHRTLLFAQGDVEVVLNDCVSIWDRGHTRKITDKDRERLTDYVAEQAQLGQRVAAIAYKKASKDETAESPANLESGLTLLGVVSLEVSLQAGSQRALESIRANGHAVSLISAGQPRAALAIALQARLADSAEDVVQLSGEELYRLSDRQLSELLRRGGAIFHHINPEDKWRLVNVASHSGQRVTATGYSLADVAAIRHADVAIAASPTTSGALAQSSDIVLTKPSLASLAGALTQGQTALYNFYRAIYCTLTDSASVLVLLAASLAVLLAWHVPLALTIPLILLIYIGTQLLPLIGLHRDRPSRWQIKHQFRSVFALSSLRSYLGLGLLTGSLALANYILFFIREGLSPSYIFNHSQIYFQAVTLTFVTIVLCQWVNLWLLRSTGRSHSFSRQLLSNKLFLSLFLVSVALVLLAVYWPPMQHIVGTHSLAWLDWLCALAAAAIYSLVRLFFRYERRRHSHDHIINLHREIHGHRSGAKI